MPDENPFSSPNDFDLATIPNHRQPTGRLWLAYGIASLVGPLAAAAALFAFGFIYQQSNPSDVEVNPMATILAPIALLVIGIPASYVIAGLIGMPIAFFLRGKKRLNAITVHGSALLFAALVAISTPIVIMTLAWFQNDLVPELWEFIGASLILFACLAPFVLLSAVIFWVVGVRVR